MPPTTAIWARPSATNSPTASTTKAASTTRTATSKTGGPRTTKQKFKDKAQCMVDQYDAIEAVPGVHLNGKLTLGENLADLGGLWLAWMAWQDKAQVDHLDMAAKTDGYTPEQRFWIAYAQQWCTTRVPSSYAARRKAIPTRRMSTAPTPSCRICPNSPKASTASSPTRWSAPSPAVCGETAALSSGPWNRSKRHFVFLLQSGRCACLKADLSPVISWIPQLRRF